MTCSPKPYEVVYDFGRLRWLERSHGTHIGDLHPFSAQVQPTFLA
jgi:hypothetical protein